MFGRRKDAQTTSKVLAATLARKNPFKRPTPRLQVRAAPATACQCLLERKTSTTTEPFCPSTPTPTAWQSGVSFNTLPSRTHSPPIFLHKSSPLPCLLSTTCTTTSPSTPCQTTCLPTITSKDRPLSTFFHSPSCIPTETSLSTTTTCATTRQ